MSPLNAAICTTTYFDKQKCYGPDKKILFKKQYGYLVLLVEYTEKTTDLPQV
jgi:hypothetical protein